MKSTLMKVSLVALLVVVVILSSHETDAKRKHLLLKALLMAPLKGRKLLVLPVPVPMPGGAMDHLHSRIHQSIGALQHTGSAGSGGGLYGLNQPKAYVQQHQYEGNIPGYYY